MPQGDRTGPMGQGPMTGRALGVCAGYDTDYSKGFGGGGRRRFGFRGGRGRGFGFGRGRSFNWPFAGVFSDADSEQTLSKDEEIKMLKAQAENMKQAQEDLEKRLGELEKGK